MNTLYINIRTLKSNGTHFLIIILTLLSLGCSVETNNVNEKVNDKLLSQKWNRDSYISKNSNGHFENYGTKLELEFLSNGNLLIKEFNSIDSDGSGVLPPPQGLVDTLIINGKWTYYENTNRLTLKVDDSMSHKSNYNYINWRLANIDNFQFEIENTETNDSIEIIKVNFKSKI